MFDTDIFNNGTEARIRLSALANTWEDVIKRCVVNGNAVNCGDFITTVPTEAGACNGY